MQTARLERGNVHVASRVKRNSVDASVVRQHAAELANLLRRAVCGYPEGQAVGHIEAIVGWQTVVHRTFVVTSQPPIHVA